MDNNSIIFPNKEMLASYKPTKGRGIIELSPAAAVGVPGLAGGVEVPESYMKYIVGSINVNPSTGVKSYSIKPEIEGDAKVKAALNWFNQWQDTSIQVNSNPQLRDLLSKAGNDALAIDIKPIGKGTITAEGDITEGNMAELSVKGKPETKIQVPKEAADQIAMLRSQTGAANVHDAKFIRLKGEEPAAKAPAPTQGGLPATQPPPATEIQDAKGNPFAEKIKKIQTTETESNKNAVKEEIDFVVKTASRLSEALTGLSKGEYPKTLEYLPRAKQEALKGSSLENLRTEYNTLANLKEAIDYIKNNPNTPEAAQAVKVIKQKLGI
jgi:hypothetical protein